MICATIPGSSTLVCNKTEEPPAARLFFVEGNTSMDVLVTFEEDEPACPRLSLLQLRELFEDLPTVPLVVAMCEQARHRQTTAPARDIYDVIRAMYDVPAGRDPVTWVEEELSWRHVMALRMGVTRWTNS